MQECTSSSAPAEVHDCKVLVLAVVVCHAILLMNVYCFSNKLVRLIFRLHLWWPNVQLMALDMALVRTDKLGLPASGIYGHNSCPNKNVNNEAHRMLKQPRIEECCQE